MKKKHMIFWVAGIVTIVLLAIILIFYSMNRSTPMTGEEISASGTVTIGIAGDAQTLKNNTLFLKGVDLAVSEINKKGGIKGKIVVADFQDDGGNLVNGNIVANKFALNRNVLAVVGHNGSDVTLQASRVYNLAGKLSISPHSTSDRITSMGYPLNFMTTPSNSNMAQRTAQYLNLTVRKRIAIFYADTAYGRDLADDFEFYAKQYGINVIDRVSDYGSVSEFNAIYDKWHALDCDGVFLAHVMPKCEYFLNDLRALNAKMPVYGSEAIEFVDIISKLGPKAEGIGMLTTFNLNSNRSQLQDFRNAFKARYNQEPDNFAAKGYDSIKLIADAAEKSQVLNANVIAEALKSQNYVFDGVIGSYSFTDKGAMKPFIMYQKTVVNGKYEYVELKA